MHKVVEVIYFQLPSPLLRLPLFLHWAYVTHVYEHVKCVYFISSVSVSVSFAFLCMHAHCTLCACPLCSNCPIAYDAHWPFAHFARFAHGLLTSAPCMQVNANVGAQLRDETRFQSSSWLPLACCALGNLRQGGQVSTEDGILKIPEEGDKERARRTVINHAGNLAK